MNNRSITITNSVFCKRKISATEKDCCLRHPDVCICRVRIYRRERLVRHAQTSPPAANYTDLTDRNANQRFIFQP